MPLCLHDCKVGALVFVGLFLCLYCAEEIKELRAAAVLKGVIVSGQAMNEDPDNKPQMGAKHTFKNTLVC